MELENEAKLGRQCYKETLKTNEKWPKNVRFFFEKKPEKES
jgi:hypothetical protein